MVGLVLVASCQTLKRCSRCARCSSHFHLVAFHRCAVLVVIVVGMLCRVRAHNFQFCRKWDCTMVVRVLLLIQNIYLSACVYLSVSPCLPPVRRVLFFLCVPGAQTLIPIAMLLLLFLFYFIFICSLSFDHCYFFAHIICMVVIVRLLAESGAWIWHIFITVKFSAIKMLDLHGNAA